MLWGKGWPEVARGTGRVGVRARAAAHAGRAGAHPPRRSIVLPKDQGALARAPTRPAPSALPRSAFAAPARIRSLRLRAARDTHRARLLPWQARDGVAGARGGVRTRARARESSRLAGASVRRLCGGYVYCYVNSLTHTQTHTKTRPARRKMPWS